MKNPDDKPEFDEIEYIIDRLHPHLRTIEYYINAKRSKRTLQSGTEAAADEIQLDQVRQRRLELTRFYINRPEEFKVIIKQEQDKEKEEKRLRLEKGEREAFYNDSSSNADFNYWAKADCWELDEAVALSLGKNPKIVNWGSINTYINYSPFAQKYLQIRDLCIRAKAVGKLDDRFSPEKFIRWAQEKDLDLPKELINNVKTNADLNLSIQSESADPTISSASKKIIRDQDNKIAKLTKEIQALKKSLKKAERSLSTRERNTILRILVGMAKNYYGYDSEVKRSKVLKEIIGDLELQSLEVDIGTLRKWLKIANEIIASLPRENE